MKRGSNFFKCFFFLSLCPFSQIVMKPPSMFHFPLCFILFTLIIMNNVFLIIFPTFHPSFLLKFFLTAEIQSFTKSERNVSISLFHKSSAVTLAVIHPARHQSNITLRTFNCNNITAAKASSLPSTVFPVIVCGRRVIARSVQSLSKVRSLQPRRLHEYDTKACVLSSQTLSTTRAPPRALVCLSLNFIIRAATPRQHFAIKFKFRALFIYSALIFSLSRLSC